MANAATQSFDAPFLTGPLLKVAQYSLTTAGGQTTVTVTVPFDVVDQVVVSSVDDNTCAYLWSASGGVVSISGLVQVKIYKISVMGR